MWILKYDSNKMHKASELFDLTPSMGRFGVTAYVMKYNIRSSDHRFLINGKRVDVHKPVLTSLGCVVMPGLQLDGFFPAMQPAYP